MKTNYNSRLRQDGVTLVELLVAMTITLFLVVAAAYVYLGTRETQRAIDEASTTDETGHFVLDVIGREVLNAGFYPLAMPPRQNTNPGLGQYDNYPPKNWTTKPTFAGVDPYGAGIFGCDSAVFNPSTGACDSTSGSTSDSVVINYFTSDGLGSSAGQRKDCLGADVNEGLGNGSGATGRAGADDLANTLVPALPVFVSNTYSVVAAQTEVNQDVLKSSGGNERVVSTGGLQCKGNGSNSGPQPLVLGIQEIRFTYGVYNQINSRLPDRFYTATEINTTLSSIVIDGKTIAPWARVVAVRICVISQSVAGRPRLGGPSDAARTYQDCTDTTKNMPDGKLLKRYVKVFGARNQLNQTF